MFELQARFQRLGYQSEIFAQHIGLGLVGRVRSIAGYEGSPEQLLLVHHSHGHDVMDDIVRMPNPIVAVYHNVTPESYFSSELERHYVRIGREQLGVLAGRALFGVTVSNFNRREMLGAGFRQVEVLPVRTNFSVFATAARARSTRTTDWLFVGRIVRNKCQHLVVRAFAVYVRHFDPGARLVLIGDLSDEDYVRRVRAEAEQLGVADRVHLPGKVSDTDLCAAYSRAGVFVSLSEHEGFGVPLIEAMAAEVPVVAYAATAVPETLGGAGILLRTQDASTVAATVHTLLSDPAVVDRLVRRQATRVRQVESFDLDRALRRILLQAAGERLPLEVQIQGPFETSYSLAAMNRRLALALDRQPELAVSLYATEGPGDYVPRADDLARHPRAAALYERGSDVPFPDVVIRQMWPPRVIDSRGAVTLEYFGWEESGLPPAMVDDFDAYLDGVGVMSTYVRDVLRDAGVTVPIRVVANGVETPDPEATVEAPELDNLRGFVFLHISSAFPRKGVDVLLRAYFDAFDGSSPVSLVLKTFPNPHNRVEEILAELRANHPDPPDVRWIDRDFDDRELEALYGLADCYVHPARGEGFGLPVAEAMLARLPVIAVAHSGLADFVSDETAITVPFFTAPAESHFGLGGSWWAEPDQKALTRAMSELVAHPDDADVEGRVQRAHDLIAREYTWDAAAKRWRELIAEAQEGTSPVQVAMVTSWNTRCGIAENSRYLVKHLEAGIAFDIFADTDVDVIDPHEERGVVRTWKNRWEPDLAPLEEALLASSADVVHVQMNFGFFEFRHLARLLERERIRRGVVVTLHRTLDYEDQGLLLTLRDISETLRRMDALIVHQEADVDCLADMGIRQNVHLVPLGASATPGVSPAEVRAALGLGDRAVIGTFGFLLPHKGTLELLGAVDLLRTAYPDILLVALCAAYPAQISRDYEARLREEIRVRRLEAHVVLITDYLPDEVARTLLRGTDVIVLPYQETGESSSAALRFVLPVGRAVVVSDEELFRDAGDAVHVVDARHPEGIRDGIERLLRDTRYREELAARAERRSRQFMWPRVAADHRQIYLASSHRGRMRREAVGATEAATESRTGLVEGADLVGTSLR